MCPSLLLLFLEDLVFCIHHLLTSVLSHFSVSNQVLSVSHRPFCFVFHLPFCLSKTLIEPLCRKPIGRWVDGLLGWWLLGWLCGLCCGSVCPSASDGLHHRRLVSLWPLLFHLVTLASSGFSSGCCWKLPDTSQTVRGVHGESTQC